ncbi:isocitrate/isopropylmalate dehydrogenase family protein [Actinoplanes sp. CA-054009]
MTRIAVLPGDGVGPSVTAEAVRLLDEMRLGLDFDPLDHVNAGAFLAHGATLSDQDLSRVRSAHATLLGAIGDPRVADPAYGRGVLLRLRTELDLYVNHRPATLLHDRLSPLRDPRRRLIDCVVVRENTEGLYAGIGGSLHRATGAEVAIDEEITTRRGVDRVLDYAIGIARHAVCLVDKSNAVPHGGALWQRSWADRASVRPSLRRSHLYVDAAAMALVADPGEFDVIVTGNSYGDILSDLTAQLAGGPGLAASANLNPETGYALYEPVHGSAPALAGTDRANPIGAILSAALLCDGLGHGDAATAIRTAVTSALAAGRCTPDAGGTLTTSQAAAAIRAAALN